MSFSIIINLAICLAYLYLLLSIVASGVAELIASYWNLRGVALRDSVRNWLGDPQGIGIADYFYKHALIKGLIRPGMDAPSLKRGSWLLPLFQPRLPSYIPKETAADVLIDVLTRTDAFVTGQMQPGLKVLWRTATAAHPDNRGAAMISFRDQVMSWFDNATTRDGERYTFWSQYRLFAIGIFLAVSLNADTLKIAHALWAPASIEQTKAMLEAAEKLVYAGGTFEESSIGKLKMAETLEHLEKFHLPLGWGKDVTECEVAAHVMPGFLSIWPLTSIGAWICSTSPAVTRSEPLNLEKITLAKILGWLITALAISFGAQFWFDALGSFVRLRSSGVQPKSSEKPAASSS